MSQRARIGLVVAVLFTIMNVAGVWFAGMAGEMLHAAAHVVFAFVGAFVAWHLSLRHAALR